MPTHLEGKQVLIVEDEYFLAADLARAFTQAGATVLGPCGHLDNAMELMTRETADAVVLDVNLDGAFTFDLADKLAAAAVPYVFVTGYDDWGRPPENQGAPRLGKPFAAAQLVEIVERLCTRPHESLTSHTDPLRASAVRSARTPSRLRPRADRSADFRVPGWGCE